MCIKITEGVLFINSHQKTVSVCIIKKKTICVLPLRGFVTPERFSALVYRGDNFCTGVIPKSLPVLSTEPVLRKAAVDREIRFSTEQYECRLRDNMILTPLERRKRKF